MLVVTLNGKEFELTEGISVLEAARRLGVIVPSLCFDPRLAPIGSCRLCLVDIAGQTRPQLACRTKILQGMRIVTHSEALEHFRRDMLAWMAEAILPDVIDAEPDKELHRLLRLYGVAPRGTGRRKIPRDRSHPYIKVDMSQCISCFRCVRICNDVQGQFVWHAVGRGAEIRIVPDSATTLGESSCVSCGACADTCPTGALTDLTAPSVIDRWTRTTCGYCGVGCEMEVGTANGQLVQIRPAMNAPVNKGHLCVKGRYAFMFTHAKDRGRLPLQRDGARWNELSWDEALDHCAHEFRRIMAAHGPHSIGILGSARATNEENYLAQKFARVVLGTNNVDCCARVCHTPSAAAMKSMLGTGASTNSFDDLERAQTIFVYGANPLENHPVVGARIRQHVLRSGARLIVADPRRTELARLAAIHLRPRPGTDIPLLNALAHVVVAEGLADTDFLATRVSDWEAFRSFVQQWPPERAAALCGTPPEDIRAAARLYATAKPAMSFHGLGLTEHVQGTEGVMALINLALLTGNIGKAGSGINPLRGQNNVQGAAHMGCDPSILTGSVAIEERRSLFEDVWRSPVPRERGLNVMAMMDAAAAGRLKALWIIGYDILPTLANVKSTRQALRNLDFVVVQDLFLSETAKASANVFLPAASVFEKDGTFMNAERRIQRVRAAVNPPGEARPDWEIICALAAKMGHASGFTYPGVEDIWNEIRAVWPEALGISYRRLEQYGLQWPCRDEDDPGTTILHDSAFAHGKRAPLQRIDYVPSPEHISSAYPFLLSTGRNLYHFNVGSMTMRTPNRKLRRTDILEIARVDADRLGIVSGRRVRVRSSYGSVLMKAQVSDTVRMGEVFATFHDARVALNKLTSQLRDSIVMTPEYKVTAVAIEPVR
jgi:formate dehydrogenase major subunit